MWNYRLVRPTGKLLPRFAEVYYSADGVPEFWSIHNYFKDILWAISQPVIDIFKRKPLKESDFVEMEEYEFNTVLTVQKDGEDYYIDLPGELTKKLKWEIEDTIRWDETEMCLDIGEYPTYTLVNESLEKRMSKIVRT